MVLSISVKHLFESHGVDNWFALPFVEYFIFTQNSLGNEAITQIYIWYRYDGLDCAKPDFKRIYCALPSTKPFITNLYTQSKPPITDTDVVRVCLLLIFSSFYMFKRYLLNTDNESIVLRSLLQSEHIVYSQQMGQLFVIEASFQTNANNTNIADGVKSTLWKEDARSRHIYCVYGLGGFVVIPIDRNNSSCVHCCKFSLCFGIWLQRRIITR